MENSAKKTSSNTIDIIKFIIGGVVTAGLLAAWVVGYFQPILLKKYEIMRLENEKATLKQEMVDFQHKITEIQLQKASLALEEENKKIKNEIAALIEKNKKLDVELTKAVSTAESLKNGIASIQKSYQETIQSASISKIERQKIIDLEKKSAEEIAKLNTKIEQFQVDKRDLATNTSQLEKDLEIKNKLGSQTVLFRGKQVTFGGKPITFGDKSTNLTKEK